MRRAIQARAAKTLLRPRNFAKHGVGAAASGDTALVQGHPATSHPLVHKPNSVLASSNSPCTLTKVGLGQFQTSPILLPRHRPSSGPTAEHACALQSHRVVSQCQALHGLGQTRLAHAHSVSSDFPGAKTHFTPELTFIPEKDDCPIPCFQVLDLDGNVIPGSEQHQVEKELAISMYQKMVQLQAMDTVFYEAQRQGRFSFYMTTSGEEAVNIATAAAISNDDHIFAQYREPGVLLWRGFTVSEFANQCFGNVMDGTKGRQMPIHYGSAKLRFQTISSPLATQIPHAVGAAYGLKMAGEQCCTVTYFGEGAASEGDFHAALNFAAVLEAPVLFVCRNNGWAISTPASEQYKGDGVAGRGKAYGVRSIRVDGNDTLAVYAATKEARRQVVERSRPVLLEALTYRTGHHSTSDDSSRYRGASEIAHWKRDRDPTERFRRWLLKQGWWDEGEDEELRQSNRDQVIEALEAAEFVPKPPLENLFTDVYDEVPRHLKEQHLKVLEAARKHPDLYPKDIPLES